MPTFPYIPFMVAFTDRDRAHRFAHRRSPYHTPWCRVLLLPSQETLPVTRATARAIIVVAEANSPHAADAARLCWEAHERHVPTVLIRIGGDPATLKWPLHPAEAVVDLAHDDVAVFEELLGRCVADTHPRYSPLAAREPADVILLAGDARPQAFQRALDFERVTNELLHPRVPRDADEEEGLALWFRPRAKAPDSTQHHPLERRALPQDPRRYRATVTPLDHAEDRARAIGSLHATHGDWSATRRLVMDCAVGSLHERARLLKALGACLREPRACTWAGLEALAREAAAATAERKGRPFPVWVAADNRAGHNEAGEPWDHDVLEQDMARTEALQEEDRFMKRTWRRG